MRIDRVNDYSFIECNARERAMELLDKGTFRELLDSFERFESPHLPKLGIVPQSDDGVVIAKGRMNGEPTVVISIEGAFQGGGIGEVSGAKIAGALELALRDCENGLIVRPILVLNTGGVRLQEGNYGLLAIAEIGAAIVALNRYVPVVGVIPGMIGCFGGMSICAGLCSSLIMTRQGRLQLNGPEVIELEAGFAEFDSGNRQLIWETSGGEQRIAVGMVDVLVEDRVQAIRTAIMSEFAKGVKAVRRSTNVQNFQSLIARIDPTERIDGLTLRKLWDERTTGNGTDYSELRGETSVPVYKSRGLKWFEALGQLSNITKQQSLSSLKIADGTVGGEKVRYIAVTTDPDSRFPRSRQGEVGVEQAYGLAQAVRQVIEQDADTEKRSIVAIIDVPSQAYGYMEELLGLHQACAAAVDAYASARLAGHPVISFIVGGAISGAFLAHGLQANRIIALDDPGVTVQVMSKASAAKVTRRSMEELEAAAKIVKATAYDIGSFSDLGAVDELITGVDADAPDNESLHRVLDSLQRAIVSVGSDWGLGHRLASEQAVVERFASIAVRKRMQEQWQ